MREQEILSRLNNIIDSAEIDLLDKIKDRSIDKMAEHDHITRQKSRKPYVLSASLVSIAAVFILMFSFLSFNWILADSYIFFDVNPSISIITNRKDKVISLEYENAESISDYDKIEFKNRDLELVLEDLIKSMGENDFIGEDDYVLLSVYNKDEDKQIIRELRVKEIVKKSFEAEDIYPVLLIQKIDLTRDLKDEARVYSISVSRMSFINKIMELKPDLDPKLLSKLSIKELINILEESNKGKTSIEDIIKSENLAPTKDNVFDKNEEDKKTEDKPLKENIDDEKKEPEKPKDESLDKGSDNAKDMISIEKTKEIALKTSGGGKIVEIELELEDDGYEYEIEIINGNVKHEIEIDAYSGKVKEHKTKKIDGSKDKKEIPQQSNEMISIEKAKEIALKTTGGGRVVDVELEIKADKAEYEVEIIKDDEEHEVEIDAYTGKVLDHEIEKKDSKDEDKTTSENEIISESRAKEIALFAIDSCEVVKAEVEKTKDKAEYEIEVKKDGKKYKIEIDAYTGQILKIEEDD